jgi:hypothetical protein
MKAHPPATADSDVSGSDESTSETLQRLPNVFRNCWRPTPWYCNLADWYRYRPERRPP